MENLENNKANHFLNEEATHDSSDKSIHSEGDVSKSIQVNKMDGNIFYQFFDKPHFIPSWIYIGTLWVIGLVLLLIFFDTVAFSDSKKSPVVNHDLPGNPTDSVTKTPSQKFKVILDEQKPNDPPEIAPELTSLEPFYIILFRLDDATYGFPEIFIDGDYYSTFSGIYEPVSLPVLKRERLLEFRYDSMHVFYRKINEKQMNIRNGDTIEITQGKMKYKKL